MKPLLIAIRDEAQAELDAIVTWYESQREGLGGKLLEELEVVYHSM